MLDKIKFFGFDVKSSSLNIREDDSKGGRYKINFSEHKVTTENDEDGNWLFIEVSSAAIGYSSDVPVGKEEESEAAFIAEATMVLTFQCNFEEDFGISAYNENQWFFDNYIFLSTKLVLEKMLSQTLLNSIEIPWSPKLTDADGKD